MTDISIFRYDVLYVYIYLLAMAVKTSVLEKTQERCKEIVTIVNSRYLKMKNYSLVNIGITFSELCSTQRRWSEI